MNHWNHYPVYKPLDVEWLREIPAHWRFMPVKRVTTFSTGWTPPTSEGRFYGGGHLWANISDLGPRVLGAVANTISDEAVQRSRMRPSPPGSLLFAFKLSVGAVSIAGTSMYTNEAIATFVPQLGISVGYLYWAAPIYVPQNAIENIYGAPLLSRERIANAFLGIPSIDEQRAIAAFLDRETAKIDALVAKKERLIELLQEKRTALITRAVTSGLDQKVRMKGSGVEWLGPVPAHWNVTALKAASTLQTGITLGKRYEAQPLEVRPYLRVANVQDGYLKLDDIAEIRVPRYEADRCELRAGDVLMTEGGDFDKLGRGAVWNEQIPRCLHQNHIFAVRPGNDRLNSQFLALAMSSAYGRTYFTATSKQSTNLASTNSTKLRNFPLPLPPRTEQDEIVRYVLAASARLDALVQRIAHGIARSKELRTALISAAVTGKIDVRESAADAR